MPDWTKNLLLAVVMVCSAIIGMRVYLELSAPQPDNSSLPRAGQHAGAPEVLPGFTLNDTAGRARDISEWSGQPLLLNFWATWCAPCRREIPLLQKLHSEQAVHGIQVVGIAIDRRDDVELFLAEYGVTYPNLVGEADAIEVSALFGLEGLGLPFSVLSAADNNILTVHIGEIDGAQLAKLAAVSGRYAAGQLDLQTARDRLADL